MDITNIDSRAKPTHNAIDIPMSNVGMTVTVGASTSKIGKADFLLSEDFTFDLTPDATHDLYAMVYLAKEKAGGAPVVLVDELVADPVNHPIPYDFEDPSCPYVRVHQLAQIKVVPGATDLDSAVTQVWRIVPLEE